MASPRIVRLLYSIMDDWVNGVGGLFSLILMAVGFTTESHNIQMWMIALGYLTGFTVLGRMGLKNLELQDRLAPKIRVSCGTNVEGSITGETLMRLFDATGHIWNSFPCRFYRLAVVSVTGEAIQSCKGLLVGIEKDGKKLWGGDTQIITFAPGGEPDSQSKTIHSTPEFLDLFCVSNLGEIHVAAPALRWRFQPTASLFAARGDYILRVVIQGQGIRPVNASIKFSWTGDWETSSLELIEQS